MFRDRRNLTGDILKLRLLTTDLDLLRRLGYGSVDSGECGSVDSGVRLRLLECGSFGLGCGSFGRVRLRRLGEMLKLLLPPDLDLLLRLLEYDSGSDGKQGATELYLFSGYPWSLIFFFFFPWTWICALEIFALLF